MMGSAIGMIEYQTVSAGMYAADTVVKTAEVEIIEAQTVCPGKYIMLFSGEISAVSACVDAAKNLVGEKMINSFVLGNPHESVIPAIYGVGEVNDAKALGVLETYDASTIIVAADEAAKTSMVELIELRVARGMCGKSYMLLTGEIAAVSAAIEKAKEKAGGAGMFLDSSVIANPDKKLWQAIL